jgi:ribosomal-protein-alanine N-acetyltransferase
LTEVVPIESATEEVVLALADLQRLCNPSPWTPQLWAASLGESNTRVLVVQGGSADRELLAYLVVRTAADEAEILDTGVRPSARRAGLGGRLLSSAIVDLRAGETLELFLEVRVSNAPAQAMYERFGFEKCGVRRGYYDRPVEDAAVMRLDLRPTS